MLRPAVLAEPSHHKGLHLIGRCCAPSCKGRNALRSALFAPIAACAALGLASPVCADGLEPADFLHDASLYFTAPLHWDEEDWLYFGGTVAAIGAAHSLGQDPNSTRDAEPAVALLAGTWLVSVATGDEYGKGESYTMIEATVFSSVTVEGLKFAAGRERPNATLDANDWRVSGSSFPSLHSSAAFAIGTVFAESGDDDYRWLRRFIGYGMAAATGYLRLHDNAHWFSDVVAGAAVGAASARFSMNRRLERVEQSRTVDLSIAPTRGGGMELLVSLQMN